MPVTILSPHPDDAVLSLWHTLTGDGDVTVLNVFAGDPQATAVGWWDSQTGATDPRARMAERREEDRVALALAGREAVNLGFVDYQYRGGVQPLEPVVAAIEEAAPSGLLLGPSNVAGDHPDHTLVRDAALAFRERGREVSLYADLPHATRHGVPGWVAGSGEPPGTDDPWRLSLNGAGVRPEELRPDIHRLDPADEARKHEAVTTYRTQYAALDDMFHLTDRPELLRYEVVWPLPSGG